MRLPRTVIALGAVSFFTDVSSEMIYPLLPVFLSTVLAAGPAALGAIEGVAESLSSLLKIASGKWSDKIGRRVAPVVAGYSVAGFCRPLIGLATGWWHVLALRSLDRVGKGIRTSPRDALIADVTEEKNRGAAFGFHRAMDHAGSVLGPLLAAALLQWAGLPLRHVFLLAAIPAVIVIFLLIAFVREPAARNTPEASSSAGRAKLPGQFKIFLAGMILFTLGNSADSFFLLRLSEAGVSAPWIAVLWAAHSAVKMLSAGAGGVLSDRVGRKPLILGGWALYAVLYACFGFVESREILVGLFLFYGVYFGLTEPAERAWTSDLVSPELRATAFGYLSGAVGLATLPANLLFGFVWQKSGVAAAFLMGAGFAFAASLVLWFVRARPAATQSA